MRIITNYYDNTNYNSTKNTWIVIIITMITVSLFCSSLNSNSAYDPHLTLGQQAIAICGGFNNQIIILVKIVYIIILLLLLCLTVCVPSLP